MLADHILHVEFCAGAAFVADEKGGAGDVLEARVFDPEFFGVVFVDGDGGGNIFELIAHEYEAGFLRLDGRFALSFKRGIQQRKWPAW